MKLVMTLLVQNEGDIVGSNMDFHLAQGVDFIIAMDNRSTDGTAEILRDHERRGRVRFIEQPDSCFFQSEWVTQMARMACVEFGADWVINDDGDEFWWPVRGNLKDALAAVDPACAGAMVARTNFVPPRVARGFFADAMTLRERRSLNVLGAPLPGKVCHRGYADIEVGPGSHTVSRGGRELAPGTAAVEVFHFPVRSYAQFTSKVARMAPARPADRPIAPTDYTTWRHMHDIWQRGELGAFYEGLIPGGAALDEGLKNGDLLIDERLKNFLAGLRGQAAYSA